MNGVQANDDIDATAARWIARRDAGLTHEEENELQRWERQDPRHREALVRFAATWTALAQPRQRGEVASLAGALGKLQRTRRRRRAAAAVSTVMMIALMAAWWPRAERAPAGAGASASLVVRAERRTLPDGSIVELKADAAIAVDYTGALRRVRLVRGEALFHVATNPDRAFVVHAAGIEVRAVGTAFSVQLNGTAVEVLVTEGRVALDEPQQIPPGAAAPATPALAGALPVTLAPRTLTFVDAGNRVVVETAAAGAQWSGAVVSDREQAERLAWRAPRVEFSGTPLAEVVAVMNRHNATQFLIADTALGRVQLSGLFRVDDTAAFIGLLEAGFGVKAERRGEHEIVLRRAP